MNRFVVNGQVMTFYKTPEPIPKGQSRFSKVEFILSEEWEDFAVVAQFYQAGLPPINVPLKDSFVFVPSELDVGKVWVSIRGSSVDGATIATVNRLSLEIVDGFDSNGMSPVPPTPDLYSELISEIKKSESIAVSSAKTAYDSAEKAELAIQKSPKIVDGNWYIWDFSSGGYVDTGIYSGGQAPYIGENGNWFVGKTDTNVKASGETPVRGKDYWTDSDKNEIVKDTVLALKDEGIPVRDSVSGIEYHIIVENGILRLEEV